MKTPFFSIIIPAYNAQDTIVSSIKSLLDQDYKKYEIIVVDDGSTDSTSDKVKAIADEKIKCYHKENGGVSSARNFGLKKATGEWVIFLDADDTLSENALGKLSEAISKNDDADYIITPLKTRKHIVKNTCFPRGKASPISRNDVIDGMLFNVYSSPLYMQRGIGGKIIRRKIISDNKLSFDERLKVFEDGVFNLHALSYSNKILFYNADIYDYDLCNRSSRSNTFYPGIVNDNEIIFETIKKILDRIKYDSPLLSYLCLELFHNSSFAISREHIKTSQKIKKLKQLRALYMEGYMKAVRPKEVYKTLKIVYALCRIKAYRALLLFYKPLYKLLKHRGRV